jgi:alpha-tubulin suppressor-like RCC1 family protein
MSLDLLRIRSPAGQLGLGDREPRPRPTGVAVEPCVGAAAGWKHSGLLLADGGVSVCGSNQFGQLGVPVRPKTRAVRKSHTAAVISGPAAVAIPMAHASRSDAEQIVPADALIESLVPLRVCFPVDTAAVATAACSVSSPSSPSSSAVCIRHLCSGTAHLLALDHHGDVWAWGRHDMGQCGVGVQATGSVSAPMRVAFHVPVQVR